MDKPVAKLRALSFSLVVTLFAPLTATAQLAEVIVTAQRREQNIQDTSVAVTAFSVDRLADTGVTDVEHLQYFAPSITMAKTFGYAQLFMRGLGLNTVFANVDPSVTMYVDGAIISQPGAQQFSFFDLERVEVLRGPQGTLYGRNATAGTINLITAKPSEELQAHFRVSAGDYELFEAEGALSGSISDRWRGRAAFLTSSRGGYTVNQVTGNDVDDANTKAFRGQLLFDASDNVQLLLAAEYGIEDDASNAFHYKRETFLNPPNPAALAVGIGGFPSGERGFASNVDPDNDRKTSSFSATVDWVLNENWALKNVLNYRETDLTLFQDLDASAVITSSIQEFVFDSEHASEELQLTYTGDRARAITGVYYFTEDLENKNAIDALKLGGSFTNPFTGRPEKRVNLNGTAETESWALFWNLTYDINDLFAIKAGGRYTEDDREIVNDNVIWAGPTRLSPANGNLPLFMDAESFSEYTNELGLEYRPNDDVLLYFTYSEGFKAGTGPIGDNSGNIIKPETIDNYAIGLKSTMAGGNLILNAEAFVYETADIQLDRANPGGPTGFINVYENATNQDGQGVELELLWAPTDQLTFSASAAYQETEFGSFVTFDPTNVNNVPPSTPVPVNIGGNSARQAPELAWNLHSAYDFKLANGGVLTLSGDALFKDEHFFSEFNNSLLRQDDYTLFDARIRYTSPDSRWTAEIWGRNLTDELIESGNTALATGRVTVRTFLPPRTAGISVSYRLP